VQKKNVIRLAALLVITAAALSNPAPAAAATSTCVVCASFSSCPETGIQTAYCDAVCPGSQADPNSCDENSADCQNQFYHMGWTCSY